MSAKSSIFTSGEATSENTTLGVQKALLHQDVINLIVVFPIWAVPCPSSGWFVRAKGVCQYKVVNGCKF